MKMHLSLLKCTINQTHKIFSHFVYAQLGFNTKHMIAGIGRRLNIKYGFNPDGINRKINSIGQAGHAKKE